MTQYKTDLSGQFAIWIAILALPLLTGTMLALDYHAAERTRVGLSSALDAAALAAVTNQLMTETEREEYAHNYFKQNFAKAADFTLNVVDASADRVELVASGHSKVTLNSLGFSDIEIKESSVSILTRESVICVLTLNPDGRESFSLVQGAKFNSPTCAVQVNSSHPEAAFVDRTSSATAKDFCIRGGATGQFSPYANTECSAVEDPYKDHVAPASQACMNIDSFISKKKGAEIDSKAVLHPGTYCNDIWIVGQDILFMPGTYILNNVELWIRQSASVKAEGVTFVLRGENAVFYVEKGSEFYIKAPTDGPLAGLAIFQDADDNLRNSKFMPTGTSEMSGGSKMSIVGTVYLPTQRIEIFGNSSYGNQAPATSYIGYDVLLGRDSSVSIKVDHKSAGLPPILPRSDEGARITE